MVNSLTPSHSRHEDNCLPCAPSVGHPGPDGWTSLQLCAPRLHAWVYSPHSVLWLTAAPHPHMPKALSAASPQAQSHIHRLLVYSSAKQATEACPLATGPMGPANPPPTLYLQPCHSQTLQTLLALGGPRPGLAEPAGKAGWGFYTGRKNKPRWGRKLREGGNDCNVSTQRQTRRRLAPPHPCHPVLTFALRQNSLSGP